MTRGTGQRSHSGRMRRLASELRKLHPERMRWDSTDPNSSAISTGLWIRQKEQPNGEKSVYVIVRDKTGAKKWLRLGCNLDASDTIITGEVQKALNRFDEQQAQGVGPVATGSVMVHLRQALHLIEADGNSVKHAERRRTWVRKAAAHLEDVGGKMARPDLLAWVGSFPATDRSRREAISAANTLHLAAFEKPIGIPKNMRHQEGPPPQHEQIPDDELLKLLLRLWEGDHASAWITSWVALTGARASLICCSEVAHGLPVPIEIGTRIQAWDNKRGRVAKDHGKSHCSPLWPELLKAIPEVELRSVPSEIKNWRGPWDRAATSDQQQAYSSGLNLISNRLYRHLPKDERKSVDARVLRHRCTERLLLKGVDLLHIAELLSTSVQQLQKRYSGSYRLRADEAVRAALLG